MSVRREHGNGAASQCREEAFFFENDSERLFGVLHTPAESGGALVFCDPWAGEKIYATRVFAVAARAFCRAGFTVLRFDCRGTGDSEGETIDVTPGTLLSDTRAAVDMLAEKNPPWIALLGLRVGAPLSAMIARDDPRIKALVLWDPVARPGEHCSKIYRNELTAKEWTGRTDNTASPLEERLDADGAISIRGFTLSTRAYRQLSEIELAPILRDVRCPTAILGIGHTERKRAIASESALALVPENGSRIETAILDGRPFWTVSSLEQRKNIPDELISKTTDWLLRVSNGKTR